MKRPPKPPSPWGSTEEHNAALAKYKKKLAKYNQSVQERIDQENKDLRFREKVLSYGGDPDAIERDPNV